ncbi:MAG: ATP-dependent Clp protease ATP-binding subunit, partial [Clostridia bacterium]|nr:ATP-dependent Clp protease ATP-binding subunit [Clostridia bacterium]
MMEGMGFLPESEDEDEDNENENDSDDNDEKESETKTPSINLGSIFGNLGNFGADRTGVNKDEKKKKTQKGRKNLDAFTLNLTEKARRGEIDRVIGRENELERTIQILCRRQKNNPCLIGEPGVGKTAIAEALATKIAKGDVPNKLKNCEVCLLDMTAIVAGTQFRGQFENRMKGLVDEVKKLGNVILVIDEIHNIV